MKLEQSFSVAAPIDDVWGALLDVERAASCLPGAAITGRGPDGAYEGTFTVQLGPATGSYKGLLRMREVDEANRTATLAASGSEQRGQGGASATIVAALREQAGTTAVDVASDVRVTGRLARFGAASLDGVARTLLDSFASCLQTRLSDAGEGRPHEATVAAAVRASGPEADDEREPAARPPAEEPPGGEEPSAPVQEPPAPAPVQEPPAPAPVGEPPAPAPVQEPPAPAPVGEPPAPAPVREPPAPAPAGPAPAEPAPAEPASGQDPFGPIAPAATEPEPEPEPGPRESVPPPSSTPQPPTIKPSSGRSGGLLGKLLRRRG